VRLKDRLVKWLWNSNNVLLKRGVSLVFPQICFKQIMAKQKGFGPVCTLSFDCDFPRDIEILTQVIDLLEQYSTTASFACIGQWIRAFPEAHLKLLEAGHEIINHTETHPNLYHPDYSYARQKGYNRKRFNQITALERIEEIERCHLTCIEVLDYVPIGFRSPHFGMLHTEDVYSMLRDLGYQFSSSILAATSPSGGTPFRVPEGVWEFPLSPCPFHPLGAFDSWHSLSKNRAAHAVRGELAGLFSLLCEQVQAEGGFVNIYLDPKDIFESGELELILNELKERKIEVLPYRMLVGQLGNLLNLVR